MHSARTFLFGALAFAGLVSSAWSQGAARPEGALVRGTEGVFFGTSAIGGAGNFGTIFRVTTESEVTVLAEFTGDAGERRGAFPASELFRDASGTLWGTTPQGGASGQGTVFRFAPGSRTFATVVEFTGENGSRPEAGLVPDMQGQLWGTTAAGGASDAGTLFRLDPASGALTTVLSFTGMAGAAPGRGPAGTLCLASDGRLWGVTTAGGALDLGTVFAFDPAGPAFTLIASLTGTAMSPRGAMPSAGLIEEGGSLWGTTRTGGSGNVGTIFRIDPATEDFATVHEFAGADGATPRGRLLASASGNLWGTTSLGGSANAGTVFEFDPATSQIVTISSFLGATGLARGSLPFAGLADAPDGSLWGVASRGGTDDRGTIFRVDPATGAIGLIAEPALKPTPPSATVQRPPGSATSGPAGTPIALRGVARDNTEILQVLVSINGGPFLPAALSPIPARTGQAVSWEIDVVPENGINVVLVKSVDNRGDASKPRRLTFSFRVDRPGLAGSYAGLLDPEASSATPQAHSGAFRLRVLPTGRFTGKLTLGGQNKPIVLTGSIGNAGQARFGKTGATALLIPRKNLAPLALEFILDAEEPFTGELGGSLREEDALVASISGAQALYTAKRNPAPPLQNVPVSLLDPATDRGAYTVVFSTPDAPGLDASAFPPGHGWALFRIGKNGVVRATGRLADGTPFSASQPLVAEDTLLLFARLPRLSGALGGVVRFREEAESDADGTSLRWFRAPNARATLYPGGWPGGISLDVAGSKFVASRITGRTPLDVPPSTGAANALILFEGGGLPGPLGNLLALGLRPAASDLGAAPESTAAAGLRLAFAQDGTFSGRFTAGPGQKASSISGVVLQKTTRGFGFFTSPAPAAGKVEVRAD
jgi:uncharacterized repeat protein (TIGR03803 family)